MSPIKFRKEDSLLGPLGKKTVPERQHREPKKPKPPPEPSIAQLKAATQAGGVTVNGCGCAGEIWNNNGFPVMVQVFRILVEDDRQIGSLPTDFFQLQPNEAKPLKFVSQNDRFFIWNEQNGVCVRIRPVVNGRPE